MNAESSINTDNYTVVTLENGTLVLSEDGRICLQNRFDGSLCMVTPTNDVLNAFDLTLSEIVNHVEQSAPPSSTDHVEQPASLSPTDHVEQSASSSSSTVCASKFEVTNNEPCDGNVPNKRGKWSKNAILMLINLRIEHNKDFITSTTQKNDVTWKLISNKLKSIGVEMTPTQCNDKWRYLKGKYVAAKDNRGDRGSGEEPIDFPYFEILDEFLGKKHNVKPIAVASSVRGDTVPKENTEGLTDALQEDSDGHNDVSTEAPLEIPRKKIKTQIAERVKQNKSGLCAVWDDMKKSRDDREQNKERRHQELINVRNRAIDVFANKMDQFMEKFTKERNS